LLSLLKPIAANIHVTFPNSIALSPPSCDRVIACAFHVNFYTFGEIIANCCGRWSRAPENGQWESLGYWECIVSTGLSQVGLSLAVSRFVARRHPQSQPTSSPRALAPPPNLPAVTLQTSKETYLLSHNQRHLVSQWEDGKLGQKWSRTVLKQLL